MKNISIIVIGLTAAILLSSCGAIPTLPPLDSTITIYTPQVTILVGEVTPTAKLNEPTLSLVTVTPRNQPSQTPVPQKPSTKTPLPKSPTPASTATVAPSLTSTLIPTKTATNTPTAVPYVLQKMNPFYLANFAHPGDGCKWLGVAGQVFDKDGQVLTEIVIKAGGSIDGKPVIEDMTMPLADTDNDLAYGPGGFEITLANGVAETDSEAWIQLFNLTGDPLSEKIDLITFDDCQKNLILMNFSPN